MLSLRIFVFAVSIAVAMPVPALFAATIDLGGIKLRLPSVQSERRGYERSRQGVRRVPSTRSHQRWFVDIHNDRSFATNNQGIWIGHDERGEMAIQVQLDVPTDKPAETVVPVQFDVNGRFFDALPGVVAGPALVVIHSGDAETILSRLMSGSRVAVTVEANRIDTHLRGSSRAIGEVRRAAALQRRLFAQGLVTPQPVEPTGSDDAETIQYFLPGVDGTGVADVSFSIVEGEGLELYVYFEPIPGHGDPAHKVPFSVSETKRLIAMVAKGDEWTTVAVENRVGLFSKRIGFIDDQNGEPVEAEPQAADAEATDPDGAEEKVADTSVGAGPAETASDDRQAEGATGNVLPGAGQSEPLDFMAMTFNSYEDASTSLQFEHSVRGFSRRFNFAMAEAEQLAAKMEATMAYATGRLENRETDADAKSKLFQ